MVTRRELLAALAAFAALETTLRGFGAQEGTAENRDLKTVTLVISGMT